MVNDDFCLVFQKAIIGKVRDIWYRCAWPLSSPVTLGLKFTILGRKRTYFNVRLNYSCQVFEVIIGKARDLWDSCAWPLSTPPSH